MAMLYGCHSNIQFWKRTFSNDNFETTEAVWLWVGTKVAWVRAIQIGYNYGDLPLGLVAMAKRKLTLTYNGKMVKLHSYALKKWLVYYVILSEFLAHLSSAQDELLWSLFIPRPSVHLFVCLSVNIFKRLFLWSRWASFAQISYGAALGWGNERLLKWTRFVDQDGRHAHICYKPLKIFFSRTKDASWLNLCTRHRGREVYQVAKRIVVGWRLTFLRQGQVRFPMHLYEPNTFEWENCWEFQTTSSEASEPVLLKFHMEPP